MNKNKLFSSVFIASTLFFMACGPAAENKQAMLDRAKIFQDSIANAIRSSMAEAESPAAMPMPAPVNTTAPTNTTPAK